MVKVLNELTLKINIYLIFIDIELIKYHMNRFLTQW